MTGSFNFISFLLAFTVSSSAFATIYYGWDFDSQKQIMCLTYSSQSGTLQAIGVASDEKCREYFGWEISTSFKAACFALDVNLNVISKSVAEEYCAPANGWGLDLLSGYGCYGYRWKDNQPVAKLNPSLCEQRFGRAKSGLGLGRTKCYQLNHNNESVRSVPDGECSKRGK